MFGKAHIGGLCVYINTEWCIKGPGESCSSPLLVIRYVWLITNCFWWCLIFMNNFSLVLSPVTILKMLFSEFLMIFLQLLIQETDVFTVMTWWKCKSWTKSRLSALEELFTGFIYKTELGVITFTEGWETLKAAAGECYTRGTHRKWCNQWVLGEMSIRVWCSLSTVREGCKVKLTYNLILSLSNILISLMWNI